MAVAVVGQCLVAACVVLTGLFGAKWHVGFPMWNRVSEATERVLQWLMTIQVVWGMKGSFFPVSSFLSAEFQALIKELADKPDNFVFHLVI